MLADVMTTLSDEAVAQFEASLRGTLLRRRDTGYEAARRVWNGMIDRYPALIAQCEAVTDVVAAVNFARTHDLTIAVRGGGHNVAGHATCDDGLVIDLSPMNGVTVDAEARTARAQGGAKIGDLDRATQAFGLAAPMGVVSDTGIAGITLGGGMGWLRSKYGLSCDNLIGAEVVTADGRVVWASETENADLLWGLRGGGGNFGIVTTFEYRLYPVGREVMFTFVFHPGAQTREALRFYRDYCATASDEVSSLAFAGVIPAVPHFPTALHGEPFIAFGAMYAGPAEEGEVALRPLREFSTPLMDMSGVMPYTQAQTIFDEDYPAGLRYYWKSLNVMTFDDEVIDLIASAAARQPSPFSTIDVWHVGGAVRRGSLAHSAFGGRHAAFLVNAEANWERSGDDAANIAWTRDLIDTLEPYSDGGRYLNFPGFQEEGDKMMEAAFGAQYARLAALKAKYDPTNAFHLNQNIKPSA